jgi:hypothetical protein
MCNAAVAVDLSPVYLGFYQHFLYNTQANRKGLFVKFFLRLTNFQFAGIWALKPAYCRLYKQLNTYSYKKKMNVRSNSCSRYFTSICKFFTSFLCLAVTSTSILQALSATKHQQLPEKNECAVVAVDLLQYIFTSTFFWQQLQPAYCRLYKQINTNSYQKKWMCSAAVAGDISPFSCNFYHHFLFNRSSPKKTFLCSVLS